MLGIPLHAWGSTAKLWAEAIENIPPDRWRRRPPTLRVKVLAFNFRASTVLGVVGAGSIGQELKNSMDLLLFPRLLTIILLILVTVTVIDHGSDWLDERAGRNGA